MTVARCGRTLDMRFDVAALVRKLPIARPRMIGFMERAMAARPIAPPPFFINERDGGVRPTSLAGLARVGLVLIHLARRESLVH